MSSYLSIDNGTLGDLDWGDVQLFNTAVQSRLLHALGHSLDASILRLWTWPMHHWYLWRLSHEKGAPLDNATRLKLMDDILGQERLPPDALVMSSPDYEKWSTFALDVCREGRGDFHDTRIAPRPLNEDDFIGTLRSAEEAIRIFDPVAWSRYLILVREIILVEGGGMKSATAPVVFGAVFINLSLIQSPIQLASLLVHETSHLALNIKSAITRFFHESNSLLISPLRAEPRPPLFVLHASYVSAHVAQCMSRFAENCVGVRRLQALQLGKEAILDLVAALRVLRESELLTPAGTEIVSAMDLVYARYSPLLLCE